MQPRTSRLDRLLITAAVLAPLAMVMLSKWQSSLNSWYMTQQDPQFSSAFEAHTAAWLKQEGLSGAELVLIIDKHCPCTTPTVHRLQTAAAQKNIEPVIFDIQQMQTSATGRNLVNAIPATPTLIATRDGALVYVGPVAGGDFCTKQVKEIFALTMLDRSGPDAFFNTFSKGCYCATTSREPQHLSANKK